MKTYFMWKGTFPSVVERQSGHFELYGHEQISVQKKAKAARTAVEEAFFFDTKTTETV